LFPLLQDMLTELPRATTNLWHKALRAQR